MSVKDKVVWVTASAAGIGNAIAKRFAREGAKLAICDIDKISLKEAKKELEELGAEVLSVQYDASKLEDIDNVYKQIIEKFGRVDVLVNNAGVTGPIKPVHEVDVNGWDYTMAVNVRSPFYCMKLVVPGMIAQGGGRIVNISSQSGKSPLFNRSPYCASKMAIIGLTRTAALELGRSNITVNAVCPGSVAGQRIEFVFASVAKAKGLTVDQVKEIHYANTAIPNPVPSENVAEAVLFLSDAEKSGSITGEDMNVTNGACMY